MHVLLIFLLEIIAFDYQYGYIECLLAWFPSDRLVQVNFVTAFIEIYFTSSEGSNRLMEDDCLYTRLTVITCIDTPWHYLILVAVASVTMVDDETDVGLLSLFSK